MWHNLSIQREREEVTNSFVASVNTPEPITADDKALLDRFCFVCMIVRVRLQMWMLQGSSSSPRRVVQLSQFHQQRMLWTTTYRGQFTKLFFCWGQCLIPKQSLPSPADWGWREDHNTWRPLWTTLPEASKSCRELIRCGCTRNCRSNCKCSKASVSCTKLCKCEGHCSRN